MLFTKKTRERGYELSLKGVSRSAWFLFKPFKFDVDTRFDPEILNFDANILLAIIIIIFNTRLIVFV